MFDVIIFELFFDDGVFNRDISFIGNLSRFDTWMPLWFTKVLILTVTTFLLSSTYYNFCFEEDDFSLFSAAFVFPLKNPSFLSFLSLWSNLALPMPLSMATSVLSRSVA